MRTRIEEHTGLPYAETSGDMLAFTVLIALMIGVALTLLGRIGRQMWLTVWSACLVICSVLYLGWYFFAPAAIVQ